MKKDERQKSKDGQSGALIFSAGNCALSAEPGTLRMTARAADAERLAAVEAVVARHLVRFGEKDALAVVWSAHMALHRWRFTLDLLLMSRRVIPGRLTGAGFRAA